jgi:hypothetical protein
MARIQILAIIASLGFLAYIGRLITKGKLREEYSIVWFLSTLVLIIFSFWRNGLEVCAKMLGIYAAPNMIFTGAIFIIMVYLLHLSIVLSKVQKQNKELSQELGLLKQQLQNKKEL